MRKLTITLLGLMLATSVQATTHRTFVAASGVDGGTCGPTTPCRSLEYALSQTNDGGEIIIIQSGGYGNATGGLVINKSVSIIAEPGVFAALAPTSGNGITIDTVGIHVAIKELTINGRGGTYGINMAHGASLDLENVTISNFFSGGYGVFVSAAARVTVSNSTIRRASVGIRMGAESSLLVSQSRLTDISGRGIVMTGGTTGTTVVTATDTLVRCTVAGGNTGFDNYAAVGTVGKMYLDRVTVARCENGVINEPQTNNVTNVIALSNSFVTDNMYGLVNNTGNMFLSSDNNHVANNSIANTSGSITTGTMLH